jgi:hypothetical protein
MRKTLLLGAVVLLISSSTLQGQVRKYSNEFLSIGIGARALAMSGSVSASIGDVSAGYWNPAGLASIGSDAQVGLMHAEYFAGIAKFDWGSVAIPVQNKSRVIGLSFIRFGVDDIPNTLFLFEPDGSINYDNITNFSVADYAFMFHYAQQLGKVEGLRIGGSAKVIHRTAGGFAKSWGFGLDLGMQYTLKDHWHFGAMLRDITTTFNAWSFDFTEDEQQVLLQTGNILPESSYEITAPRIILSAAYAAPLGEKFGVLTELNFDLTTDGKRNVLVSGAPLSVDPHLGVEFNYAKLIYLRGGVGNLQRALSDDNLEEVWLVQPNIGVGLRIKSVALDYAFTNISGNDQLLYSHVFSLMVDINKRQKPNG